MFDQLSNRIQDAFKKISSKGVLTEKDIDDTLRTIRMSLLEADVNYRVIKEFTSALKERLTGENLPGGLNPSQAVIKAVNEELIRVLSQGSAKGITVSSSRLTNVMMVGLNGSGKTTSTAKLALFYKNKGKRVLVAGCDLFRLAAVEQLRVLCRENGLDFFETELTDPIKIALEAKKQAEKQVYDILILDTAGRQSVDSELMEQVSEMKKAVNPTDILYTIDAMMGQSAVDNAKAFDETLNVTGFLLTKADSDARGGAALSVAYVTGKPILFYCNGEKPTDIELFHPERIAGRILGMGDVMSLIEKAQASFDGKKTEKLSRRLLRGEMDLEDYLEQLDSIKNMGGIGGILSMMPGGLSKALGGASFDERQLEKTKAIIFSMTPKERRDPKIINASRRRRIAAGCGMQVSDVNRLLNSFEQSKKLMKSLKGKKGKFPPHGRRIPFYVIEKPNLKKIINNKKGDYQWQ